MDGGKSSVLRPGRFTTSRMGWEAEAGWTFRGRQRDIFPVPKIEPCCRRQDHVLMSAGLWENERDWVGNWQRFSVQYLPGRNESTF